MPLLAAFFSYEEALVSCKSLVRKGEKIADILLFYVGWGYRPTTLSKVVRGTLF